MFEGRDQQRESWANSIREPYPSSPQGSVHKVSGQLVEGGRLSWACLLPQGCVCLSSLAGGCLAGFPLCAKGLLPSRPPRNVKKPEKGKRGPVVTWQTQNQMEPRMLGRRWYAVGTKNSIIETVWHKPVKSPVATE